MDVDTLSKEDLKTKRLSGIENCKEKSRELNVIQYLMETCAKLASDRNIVPKIASCSGRLDILQYIFDNDICNNSEEAKQYVIMLASLNQHSEIVEYARGI